MYGNDTKSTGIFRNRFQLRKENKIEITISNIYYEIDRIKSEETFFIILPN